MDALLFLEENMNKITDPYTRRRKLWGIISLILFAVVTGLLTVFFTTVLSPYLHSATALRAFLEGYGWKGRFILLGIQCLQVIVALIPGEIIELGAGYAYGAVEGTLLCLLGVGVSSSAIFLLVKKFGTPIVELFLPREKIQQLRFINSSEKLKRLVFFLFLIPGTPKDILTYFVGLTDLRLLSFLTISLIARIPSVASSAVCGQMLGDKDYVTAALVYAVTGVISIVGYYVYTSILKHRQSHD